MPKLRMDQPVVRLERLPDEVIARYLNKEMKVYEYSHGYKQLPHEHFSSKKHARNKPYWIKRGTVHSKFYNNTVYHKHSNSKVVANGFYNNFRDPNTNNSQLYPKKDKFHHGQRNGNNIMIVPNNFHHSECHTTGNQVSSEIGNSRTFSNNQDRTNKIVSSEHLLRQGKKKYAAGEKVSRKDVTSFTEDCEDGSENLIYEDFNSHDWQIVSEASCSDVSSEGSPSHDNDADYSVPMEAEIKETSSKHKITSSNTTCIDGNVSAKGGKLQDTQNSGQIIESGGDDDDDRLTEPYRSDCEDENSKVQDVRSTKSLKSLRIKLTGSHKNGFTNVTNESDKLSRNKMKAVAMTESKDESSISRQANARNMKIASNVEKGIDCIKNGQGVANKETKFSRYDYVGLIMQTMDKSGPYSVNAKSDDTTQKPHGTGEGQNFKSSSVNKETSIPADGKQLPEIPYLKQRKARMSRPAVSSKTKSFLCRDLKGVTGINKPHLNYIPRPVNMSEPKSNLIMKDNIKISGDRKVDAVGNSVNSGNKKLNSTILIDKQGVRPLLTKSPTGRRCWRCGKPFGSNSSITDRLCKQCNAFDYTTVAQRITNIQTTQKPKDSDCSNKLFKISYNQMKSSPETVTSPDRSKPTEETSLSNATSLLHHSYEENHINKNHAENENLSPLKLKVSLGPNNKLIEKSSKDREMIVAGDTQIKKLKKKRMRSASDTLGGIYEANKHVAINSEQTSGGNLIYTITKRKGKHKDLSKKRKKIKLGADDEGSDISGYYSEDNITSKCKTKELSSETGEMLAQSATNQVGNITDHNISSSAKPVLNKKGSCEVRSVNKGLFLLSFPETDDENYQLESVLGEFSRKEGSQKVMKLDGGKENSSIHSRTLHHTGNTLSHQSSLSDLPSSASATTIAPTEKTSCPTFVDLQSLVNTSETTIKAISQEMSALQNASSEQNNDEANKFQETKDNFCDGTSSESKLSTLRIESVYSLQDVTSENKSNEKRTDGEKMPYLPQYNTCNELDAYTTASILDMDGTKERSLSVLMSLLNREYKGLQYVCQLSKKSNIIKMDLHTEKQRHIENIRTLQLACALFKKCQKCNKELSHEMLDMKSDEISQLLSECGNTATTDLTAMEKEKNDTDKETSHQTLETSDKEEEKNKSSDGDSVKEQTNVEMKDDDKHSAGSVTNTQKTVKFLLEQRLTSPTTAAPTVERRSDDDVICLGVSQLPKSSIQAVRSPDQQNDSSNCAQQSVEATGSSQNSISPRNYSPSVVPPNVSVIKSHGLATSPTISNFITSSNSIPLQIIPGVVNHPLQTAVNIATNTATYQKTANCFVKHQNYTLPANSLSMQKESADSLKQLYVVSQLNKLPNGTTWIPSSIQPQWTSHPNPTLATSTSTSEALNNMRNQGWRNNSPLQSNTPPSVPTQQKPVQQMPVGSTNPMLPLISQFGTAVSVQHAVHAGMPVQAARGLPPVPPMYSHSAIRAWHQPSNPLGAATLRQTQQTPVVCIACRKPIGMTCPTGMFCSDVCKKSYCAHFPNYR